MESFELDRQAMVVRSLGDTPGVFAGLSYGAPEYGIPLDTTGAGYLLVDPGGSHEFRLLPSVEAMQQASDVVAHVAMLAHTAAFFLGRTQLMLQSWNYESVAMLAAVHGRFVTKTVQWGIEAYGAREVTRAIEHFGALDQAHLHRLGGACNCPVCSVKRDATGDPTGDTLDGSLSLADLAGHSVGGSTTVNLSPEQAGHLLGQLFPDSQMLQPRRRWWRR